MVKGSNEGGMRGFVSARWRWARSAAVSASSKTALCISESESMNKRRIHVFQKELKFRPALENRPKGWSYCSETQERG